MAKTVSRANDNSIQAVGSWAFLLGVVVALIAGAFLPEKSNPTVTSFLVLLGTIVGLLNVTRKETTAFLIASVSLVIVASFGGSVVSGVFQIGLYLGAMLDSILVFVVPATIVVALKSIFSLAETK